MPSLHQRLILKHLADKRYQPRTIRQLANELGIDAEQLSDFERAVRDLEDEGQVILSGADRVALPPPGDTMTGVFRQHERGFGFIIPDEANANGDLFIPPGQSADALTGDRVRAKVRRERGRGGSSGSGGKLVGRIIEVIQRSERQYVGTLMKRGSQFIVQTDGRTLHDPVIIRDPHAKNAREGNKVALELVTYPKGQGELPEGVITEVLGEAGEPEIETLAVMRAFGLAEEFPKNVVNEARQASAKLKDEIPGNREDLTGMFICTIDPPDAKDYDDAISIRRLEGEDGAGDAVWELGVHIADVSYFISAGSGMDEEAYTRGNSTYLPRKVIPMLPEVLSNGVCSLQEGVNRYAKTCFIRYDQHGNRVGFRFCRSVIRSAKRMTYLEAQALIDGDLREARKHAKTEPKYPKQLIETVQLMDELAKTIRERRLKDGMIVLGLPEVELVYDDAGRVVDAQPEDDAFTHTVIEMFMVEANEAAATVFHELDIPMVRRVHPDPDALSTDELRTFARVAGFNIPSNPSRKELQHLLDAVRGKPAQQAVHLAVLRTLSKAEYAPAIIGHFALASEHYTHFTSPIRRYPDFVVHRGLDALLDSGVKIDAWRTDWKKAAKQARRPDTPAQQLPDEEAMQELGRHCSTTERNSESAERELRKYLVLELLTDHMGDDFAGTVTGVTNAGAFVQIDRFLVDGFVRSRDLPGPPNERWKLNPNTGALVAQRSGRSISIGSVFTVRIANVDLARRQLELVIIESQTKKKGSASTKAKKPRRQPQGARKSTQQTMEMKQRKNQRRGRKKKG